MSIGYVELDSPYTHNQWLKQWLKHPLNLLSTVDKTMSLVRGTSSSVGLHQAEHAGVNTIPTVQSHNNSAGVHHTEQGASDTVVGLLSYNIGINNTEAPNTAVTNNLHPQPSTTLIHMKIHFPRMWAQLRMEQGSTKTKRTLEVEYRELQPNDQQEWERQVRRFINNNSDGDEHPVASQNVECENEVVEPNSGCETERSPNPSQHHESNMHTDASAPSQCELGPETNKTALYSKIPGLEKDFSTNRNAGTAGMANNRNSHLIDNASSIKGTLIAESLDMEMSSAGKPE